MSKLCGVTTISFLLFLFLEWAFWRSPAKNFFERIEKASVWWVQPHYVLRMFVLCLVLLITRVNLWPVFTGGISWLLSLGSGALLVWMSFLSFRIPGGNFWQKVKLWYREDKPSFAKTIFYLLVYPAFMEELLYRWFFTGILWTQIGWWVIILGPVLNIAWHIPYWSCAYTLRTRDDWQAFSVKLLMPATSFAIALTIVAVTTHNLIGPVIAHAFGDWAGLVWQRAHPAEKRI